MRQKLPNLFIPGAQKSATTTTATILASHPDIFSPIVKESHFFSLDEYYERGTDYYHSCYSGYGGEKYMLDGSQCYLPMEYVPDRILKTLGLDVKFIVVLRNPVDRAVSGFTHMRINAGGEMSREISEIVPPSLSGISLEDLLKFEKTAILQAVIDRKIIHRYKGWQESCFPFNYFSIGCYSKQISRFLKFFPRGNFVFFSFDQVIYQQNEVKRIIADFLDLDVEGFEQKEDLHSNKTLMYDHRFFGLAKYVKRPFGLLPNSMKVKLRQYVSDKIGEKPDIKFNNGTYNELVQIFSEEIDRTAEVTGLDLEKWKTLKS